MELRDAYRVLDLEVGARGDGVRDARKILVKVWHPDRHANDPETQRRAETKLRAINNAFERVRDAGFPASVAEPARVPVRTRPATAPPPTAPPPAPAPAPSGIELVPRRRVRWSVLVLLLAAVGGGPFVPVMRLRRD